MTAVMLNQQKVPLSLPTPGQALSLPHNFSFQSGLDASKSARSRACAHEVLCPRVGQVSEKGRALLPGLSLPSLLLAGGYAWRVCRWAVPGRNPAKTPTCGPMLGALFESGCFLERRAHRGSSQAAVEQEEPRLEGPGLGVKTPLGASRLCDHRTLITLSVLSVPYLRTRI